MERHQMTKKCELGRKLYVPPVPTEMETVATIQEVLYKTPHSYRVGVNGSTITSCPVDGCPYSSH
jgi:hypothetical protein